MQSSFQANAPISNEFYAIANGTSSSDPFITVYSNRDPTQFDFNYPIKKRWINLVLVKEWVLQSFSNVTGQTLANWLLLSVGGAIVSVKTDDNLLTTADPVTGILIVHGEPVTNVTHPGQPLFTKKDAIIPHQIDLDIQAATAQAASAVANAGIASFNSAQFTVDVNGFVSITNFTPFTYVQVTHDGANPSPYTALKTDDYISCDTTAATAGTITIVLPDLTSVMPPSQFHQYIIKDRTGGASTNNIFVTTASGTAIIDGQVTYTLAGNFDSINLLWNGTSYEVF